MTSLVYTSTYFCVMMWLNIISDPRVKSWSNKIIVRHIHNKFFVFEAVGKSTTSCPYCTEWWEIKSVCTPGRLSGSLLESSSGLKVCESARVVESWYLDSACFAGTCLKLNGRKCCCVDSLCAKRPTRGITKARRTTIDPDQKIKMRIWSDEELMKGEILRASLWDYGEWRVAQNLNQKVRCVFCYNVEAAAEFRLNVEPVANFSHSKKCYGPFY